MTAPDRAPAEAQKRVNPGDWATEYERRKLALTDPDAFCEWIEDSDGTWNLECGGSWVFDCGGVAENGVRYCYQCGMPVTAVPYEDPETGGEG